MDAVTVENIQAGALFNFGRVNVKPFKQNTWFGLVWFGDAFSSVRASSFQRGTKSGSSHRSCVVEVWVKPQGTMCWLIT